MSSMFSLEWSCNLCLKHFSSQKELKRHFRRPRHRAHVKNQHLAQRDDNGGQDADDELDDHDGEDDNHLSLTSEVQQELMADKSKEDTQPPPPPPKLPSLLPLQSQSIPPLKRGRGRPRKYKSISTPILPTPTASSAEKGGQGRPRKRPQEDGSKSREVVEGEVKEAKTEGSLIQGRQEPIPVKIKRGRGRPQKVELQEPIQELKCVVCNSTFACQYNLDRHFKTRLHAQNSAQSQLSPAALDNTKEDDDDNNADIQIVYEEVEKPPPNPSPSMLQVGFCFRWNGKRFQVKEVIHPPTEQRRWQAIKPK